MEKASTAQSSYPTVHPFIESVIGTEALFKSALKCCRGVMRKHSTQFYLLNIIEKTVALSRDLKTGKYKEGKTHIVPIEYPKPRTALSITFRDRVFQRSLNDVALYPQVARTLIYQNFACQKGKGTDAARKYYKRLLHNCWLEWRTNDFFIVEFDIKGYYDSMRHEIVDGVFSKRCDSWTASVASKTLSNQYKGDIGYNPGSQMVQIAGISYIDDFDHFVKRNIERKRYLHYMDDGRIIVRTEDEARKVIDVFSEELKKVGLTLHQKKTRIVPAKKGGVFIGFLYRVTDSGKVLMFRDPDKVKDLRRRYRRFANKIKAGFATIEELENSYKCARACMEKGNSARLLKRMDSYIEKIREEVKDGIH